MIIRKNIALENGHLTKLDGLIKKNDGNLSAAIRDAIEISDTAIRHFGSFEKAMSNLTLENKDLSPQKSILKNGKNVLISSPIFQWALKWTKGIPLDKEIIDEFLDPLKIRTISELDKYINDISIDSGWNCEVSIFSMDDVNPSTATVSISGNNELYRDFVSQLVVMFLAYNKGLDIETVHRRATSTRIDLKERAHGTLPNAAAKYFGYSRNAINEYLSKPDFWKHLFEIFSSVNYNMVSLHKNHYENLLAGNAIFDAGIFESLSKQHISSINHQDFLKLLKSSHESLLIVDKIEILEHGVNVYHSYKNEKAIQKLQNYYLSLLKANGHEYESKYSTSLIILNHTCCKNKP